MSTNVPNDLDAERWLLGACIYRPAGIDEVVAAGLEPEHLYHPAHRELYERLTVMNFADEPISPTTIAAAGITTLDPDELVMNAPQVSAPTLYADVIIEAARRRRLLHAVRAVEGAIEHGDDIDLARLRHLVDTP